MGGERHKVGTRGHVREMADLEGFPLKINRKNQKVRSGHFSTARYTDVFIINLCVCVCVWWEGGQSSNCVCHNHCHLVWKCFSLCSV